MNAIKQPFPSNPEPLREAEFEGLMEACGPWNIENPHFAVAVSGGPDSTALALLLDVWLQKRQGKLLALIIDHRLREGSGEEARQVGGQLTSKNIPHVILTWTHEGPPQSAIHASARRARYDLLLEACRQQGIAHLFLAHHADDQAETILMRLSRSTGIDGLAGMAVKREQEGILLVRPLLPVRKSRLEATCRAQEFEFLRDPSNDWERFTRAKLRSKREALSRAGLSVNKLADIAREAGLARAYLETACNDWLKAHATVNAYGVASLSYPAWLAQEGPMRLRTLSRALVAVGGGEYPPRGDSLSRLCAHLAQSQGVQQTLGGCHIQLRQETVLLMREAGLIEDEAPLSSFTPYRRWDNRFVFHFPNEATLDGATVRRLGHVSRHVLEKKGAARLAQLPATMREGLPGIFRDSELFMLPDFALENPLPSAQAVVTAVFSPRHGFFVKPFMPSSFIMAHESLFGVA
ncbi:MAG: tRNA lysidine(34) synthetase TilS [Proteobacteria bacterium]|nr:tRNA lysidine(34) synthetase TilS [Pseudomonadota bacterium]